MPRERRSPMDCQRGEPYNRDMATLSPAESRELRALVDEYRSRCLWFLRIDYYPGTVEEIQRVLDAIQRRGDRSAFQRSAEIKQWLSRPSSATSAGS